MSRTTNRMGLAARVLLASFACAFTVAAGAQTLGELAEAQRLKQQAEIVKAKKELEAAESGGSKANQPQPKLSPEAARTAARLAEEAARPKVVLHALYARNGVWVAELASQQRLALALVGMRIYGYRISGIGQQGLVLSKPCSASDVREKAKCGTRVMTVGEAV